MFDLTPVYMWTFADATGPHFPGPVVYATEGESISLSVTNTLDEDHAFAVVGTTINTGPIPPGGTANVTFTAPAAGTYIYHDPLNAPVNRVLGLHGALVVMPVVGNTPYTAPPATVQQLFNDLPGLANPEIALGEGWIPSRQRIWLHHSTDPAWNGIAETGQTVNPVQMLNEWKARYFTINGHSAYFASHHPDILPHGRVGQAWVLRLLNTGMVSHSPHIHGNHVWILSVNGVVQSNLRFVDTFSLHPMDRVDWLLGALRPPDIQGPKNVPLRVACAQELAFVDSYGLPQCPLGYPMHSHNEPDQSGAGGNYPGGAVTHWEIIGDVDGVDFVCPPFGR